MIVRSSWLGLTAAALCASNSEALRRRLMLLGLLSDLTSRLFDSHADFLCGEHVMGLQAKNENGTVIATPGFAPSLSCDYQLQKELGKLINGGQSIKVALNKAVENTTLRGRFFTTPCALQVRTGPQLHQVACLPQVLRGSQSIPLHSSGCFGGVVSGLCFGVCGSCGGEGGKGRWWLRCRSQSA